MDLPGINAAVDDLYRGRRWVLAPDVAAGAVKLAARLDEAGAAGVMVVAGSEGTGDLPAVDRIHYVRTSGSTIMEGFRRFYEAIENPSPDLLRAIDAFDPEGDAFVLGAGFSRNPVLAGRPVYGRRRAEWRALEDKTVADALWDEAGIARAPSAIVAVDEAAAASRELASGLGTVWVADNLEGWHGGGEYTRWISSPTDAAAATAWFSTHANTVRVMPFLDGLPCSIHGFITDDGIAVFRPVELFILRAVEQPRFFYAQGSNFWSPPTVVFEEMRSVARAVGEVLRRSVDYRGSFGIDGICTADGFRPTELNPRRTVGHGMHTQPFDIPLDHMERMMLEGDLSIDARDLEETVMAESRTRRHGGAIFPIMREYPAAELYFRFDGGAAVTVDAEGVHDGTMAIGPAAFGSVAIVRMDPDRTPVGPSLAPRVIRLLDLAREEWGVEVPDLTHAPDLCGA